MVILIVPLLTVAAQAQSPSKEIGLELVRLFRQDSVNEIQRLRVPVAEISLFLHQKGIDTFSTEKYISKYPAISKSLIEKAVRFRKDTANFPIKWKSVEVVGYRENTSNNAAEDNQRSFVNIIEFKSDTTSYILFFDTVADKNGRWYLGNFIDLVQATLSAPE